MAPYKIVYWHLAMVNRLTSLLLILFILIPTTICLAHLGNENSANSSNKIITKLRGQTDKLNVQIPELELAARLAIKQFPELIEKEITIQYGDIFTSMMAQPKVGSLLFDTDNHRKYRILVNNDPESPKAQLIHELNLEGKVALLAHEFAHILDYTYQTKIELLHTGIAYMLYPKFKRQTEHEADHEVIKRGLGNGLKAFSKHVFNHAKLPKAYKEYKRKFYLSPQEISIAMQEQVAP